MCRVESIIKQALKHGLKSKGVFYITPGSEQVWETCAFAFSVNLR